MLKFFKDIYKISQANDHRIYTEITTNPDLGSFTFGFIISLALIIAYGLGYINFWIFLGAFLFLLFLSFQNRINKEKRYSLYDKRLEDQLPPIVFYYKGIRFVKNVFLIISAIVCLWLFFLLIKPVHWYGFLAVVFCGLTGVGVFNGLFDLLIVPVFDKRLEFTDIRVVQM